MLWVMGGQSIETSVRPVCAAELVRLCNHAFWCNASPAENADFSHGDVVFCKIDEVWRLFRALRRTRKRVILVTGEGDKPVTPHLYAQKPPHVFHWFGTNMFAEADDTTPVPLGLGGESDATTLNVSEIEEFASRGIKRDKLLYANFGAASNPRLREPLRDWLRRPEQNWIKREEHTGISGRSAYLEALFSHHFVFCPPGNGEDTHRMWEALYCGAIPVVRESPAMRNFKDLPILFVPKLDGISEGFLRAALADWPAGKFQRDKLDIGYWQGEFAKAQRAACKRGPVSIGEWGGAWVKEVRRIAIGERQHDGGS